MISLFEKSSPSSITPASTGNNTERDTFVRGRKVWQAFDVFQDHVHKGNS